MRLLTNGWIFFILCVCVLLFAFQGYFRDPWLEPGLSEESVPQLHVVTSDDPTDELGPILQACTDLVSGTAGILSIEVLINFDSLIDGSNENIFSFGEYNRGIRMEVDRSDPDGRWPTALLVSTGSPDNSFESIPFSLPNVNLQTIAVHWTNVAGVWELRVFVSGQEVARRELDQRPVLCDPVSVGNGFDGNRPTRGFVRITWSLSSGDL